MKIKNKQIKKLYKKHFYATEENTILQFIQMFQTNESICLFTQGMCYWFAIILKKRFKKSKLIYDCINGHFAVEINKAFYDITGKVNPNNIHGFVYWDSYNDTLHKTRIIKDVILKCEKK